ASLTAEAAVAARERRLPQRRDERAGRRVPEGPLTMDEGTRVGPLVVDRDDAQAADQLACGGQVGVDLQLLLAVKPPLPVDLELRILRPESRRGEYGRHGGERLEAVLADVPEPAFVHGRPAEADAQGVEDRKALVVRMGDLRKPVGKQAVRVHGVGLRLLGRSCPGRPGHTAARWFAGLRQEITCYTIRPGGTVTAPYTWCVLGERAWRRGEGEHMTARRLRATRRAVRASSLLAAVVATAAVFAAGCGSDDSSGGSTSQGGSTSSDGVDQAGLERARTAVEQYKKTEPPS